MSDLYDPETFAVIEPRIPQIARELERLLSIVELEKDGVPVKVDGFRLRDLVQWQSHTADSAMNALIPISGVCNSRCCFCFEHGIPFPRELSLMPLAEARTRLKYYDPETGKSLFPSNRPQKETFVHPQALDIIEMTRERDPQVVYLLTTNGSYLDEDTVQRLARLKPLMIKLSLNVADPELHRQLMGVGKRTSIALGAARLLQKYRVPFTGGIVAWPTLPKQAIAETVGYLDRCEAYSVRIRLPLTHRWLREQPICDFRAHWDQTISFARQLQTQCQAPLIVEPPAYWVRAIIPEVDGVVLNSPAHRVGIRCGDVVRSINGLRTKTRTESEALLYRERAQGESVDLVLQRDGVELEFRLENVADPQDTYPYDPEHYYRGESFGIIHVADFRLGYAQRVFEIIQARRAKHVLIFSSPIVAPIFEAILNHVPEYVEWLRHVTISMETVTENTLGGNFDLVESRFVSDYAHPIRKRLARGQLIDLILIPDAFGSHWGTDLSGVSFAELEMEFGIPVELIPWYLVYGPDA
jgi:hypothetical protein